MASQLSKRLDALEKNQPDKGTLFVSELQRMFGIKRIDEAVKAGREGMQQLLNDGYTQMTWERGQAAADAWLNLFVKRKVKWPCKSCAAPRNQLAGRERSGISKH